MPCRRGRNVLRTLRPQDPTVSVGSSGCRVLSTSSSELCEKSNGKQRRDESKIRSLRSAHIKKLEMSCPQVGFAFCNVGRADFLCLSWTMKNKHNTIGAVGLWYVVVSFVASDLVNWSWNKNENRKNGRQYEQNDHKYARTGYLFKLPCVFSIS